MKQTFQNLLTVSIIFSTAAILIELFIIPMVRILPERYSFWNLWVMLAAALILATLGIFAGAAQFKKEKTRRALMGFLLGQTALLLILLYWLIQTLLAF
ncbi:MAG: hypothetical protein B6D41_17665 [Chloroflexi bacterium UTCFX4]|nr:MAG: hypothetical protein B6D41_17665 [Chloroflexi bacterium UTCFX4]